MIKITFPDGRVNEYEKGITGLEIAQKINQKLGKESLGIVVNGETRDLTRPIDTDATVKLLLWDDDEGKKVMWHSSAHLMAEALEELYPGVKFGIGPPVANGYYYDIDLGDHEITASELAMIEKMMLDLARKDEKFVRKEVSKVAAIDYFTKKGDEYKLELLQLHLLQLFLTVVAICFFM